MNAWMLVAVIAAGVGVYAWRHRVDTVPETHGGLGREVYVWQRAWTDDVKNAIDQHGRAFDRVVVLGAQIVWEKPTEPHVFRVAVDWGQLHRSARDVGAAIRIGSYPGPYEGPTAQLVAGIAVKLCDDAGRAGVKLSEIQIDFDSAESKLDGYRAWVHAAKQATRGVPVHITALPSWVRLAAFESLVREAGGYVLQVHSLDRPKRITDAVQLCDPRAAVDAVQRAGRIGVPFRVALPTYGYVLVFDHAAQYVGLEAEGPSRSWPAGVQKRWLGAQSDELAQLCKVLEANHPICLSGIIWYRLPIEADRNNWRWETLAAVMDGKSPQAKIAVEIQRKDGVNEISVVNRGQADYRGELLIATHWDHANLQASDVLGGFEESSAQPDGLRLKGLLGAGQRIAPGERRQVGWIRLDNETEVSGSVEKITQ
jgi:hypothetical protein